ncbi:MAG: cation diffusion facilitator family transporter [Clostridia bacterium]|nr:cation diffusion facilitator family transporter [Clostridia bacterium]
MTELLCKLFVKNYKNTSDISVRARYGTLAGIVGIIVNLILFAGKFVIGTLTASIAITADAINNLSDAGSSVISLISFRISSKPADREHPFGHARIEYIASMIVSFIILFIGITLMKDSAMKIIFGGDKTDPSIWAIVVLIISILGKLWLFLFNRKLGVRIGSAVMKATAADSLSDAMSTAAVLASTLIYRFADIELDAYMGIIVAILILRAGIGILREALNSILGTAPDEELVELVKETIFSHPEALGIHDLVVHSYGPGRCFLSCHVEVDGGKDIYASHDAIDNIEKELKRDLGVIGVIHLDPVAVGDPTTDLLREKVTEIAADIDERTDIHDFRLVPGTTHTNLIFDVVVPFEVKMDDKELCDRISEKIKKIDENYFAVITVDRQ